MNGASPKKTPERDSRSGSAGYILMWVLWGEIKFRTFLPPSWIIGTCHPSSIVNMFLILSSLHLSFSVGYSRTDYLGFISKDLIFLKSCGIYSSKKNILSALVTDFGSFYMSVQDLQSAKCVIAELNCCDSNSLTAHRLSLISPSLCFWGSYGFWEQISFKCLVF